MPEPYPFQKAGVDWMAERRTAVLADEMGLGKTAQAVLASDVICASTILVISPAIARDGWAREFAGWQQIDRTIQIIRSATDAENLHGDIVIISYALVPRILPALLRLRFDIMVLDEAQALKSIDAARAKAIYDKAGLITRTCRIWALSGTLAPNNPSELWTHYFCLFKGPLDYPAFVARYCIVEETSHGQRIIGANPARAEELARFMAPHILQRRVRDVLPDLPALRWGHIPVRPDEVPPQPGITPEVAAILHKIERDEALSVTEQMALATLRRWTGIAKAPAVLELIQAELESTDKIVVFAVHRQVIARLKEGLGILAGSIHGDTPQRMRQVLIDSFQNADNPRVLIIQLATGGTAITLTRAHRVIFAEASWVPADMAQAAARCHRIGQSMPVLVSIVSLAGSIDERINGVLLRKAAELAAMDSLISKHHRENATS
jgi:SWI/SNF-related matrix-associated actin-dependent regulator of chromatin subfamily A-like protein 1